MKKITLLIIFTLTIGYKFFAESKPNHGETKNFSSKLVTQDVAPPTITNLYPANQFDSFLTTENLRFTFNEPVIPVILGPLNKKFYIVIRNETDNVQHQFFTTEDLPEEFNTTFTINPTSLLPNKEYSVSISAGAFRNASGNEFAGLSSTRWRFIPKNLSPSGISSGLKLWLRADKGLHVNSNNEIISWEDQSGNDNHATASSVGNGLRKVDNVFNFNPAVYFENGDNSFFNIDLSSIKNKNYNIITVLQRDNSNTNSYILGTAASTLNQGLHFGYRSNSTATLAQFGNDVNLTVDVFNQPQVSPAILRGELNQSSGRTISELRDDDFKSQSLSTTNPLTGNANGQLGRGFNNTGYEGYLAEVIVYSKELSANDINSIYSYLAIKYGFTLKSTFSSTFSGFIFPFWNPNVNANYNDNITIIARDKISDLRQSKSKNNFTSSALTIEKPGGVRGSLIGIAVGNNNESLTFTSTNAPQGFDITNRKWLMMVTADLTGISMSFEVPNNSGILSDYRLYFSRSDTNFTASGFSNYSPTSISGNTIKFTNLATNNLFISGFDDTSYLVLAKKSNPTVTSLIPENNTEDVVVTDNLQIAFSENVLKGTGNITIYDASDNSVFETISANSSNITVSGAIATINPTKDLEFNKNYYINVSHNAFKDSLDNAFTGISNATTWTLSTELTGPAGITSGLQLWLKANEGLTTSGNSITEWKDQSSYKRSATLLKTPTIATNPINLNNAVHFDGTGAGFQITDGILGTNTYSNVWVYTVQNVERLTTGYIFREDMADDNRLTSHIPWSNGYAYFDFGLWNGLGRVQTNTSVVTINETDLWTLGTSTSTSTPSGFRKSISKNGLTIASNNTDNTTESRTGNNSDFFVGVQTASGGGAYHGDIAEMIIYTSKPTAFQQQKIQSYLAMKYGITLDRTDVSAAIAEGHYLNSDGTIIWNTYDNASYHNNIAIITKDVGSVLQQDESKSVNAISVLSVGKSGGIINDKDAIAIGSNNQPFKMSPASAPTGYNISNRVWKMQKTGSLDDIFFRFDIPDNTGNISDYQVIMSSSPTNFTTGTTVFPATSIQGNTVNVNRISTVNGNYYVLAQKIIPPKISSLSPEDDSQNVTLQNSLTVSFSENILKNTGNITLHNAIDNSILEIIDVNSNKVSITNNVATIIPTYSFSFGESYYILIDSGTFRDTTLNPFEGISDTSIWNFSFSQNTAPTFTTTPIITAGENSPYEYIIRTNDLDNNNVIVTTVTKPSWLTLESKTTVSTLAGNGNRTYQEGTRGSASFDQPFGIAVDVNDNIFVSDSRNHRIRKITPNGVTSFVTGNTSGFSDGTGSDALFRNPSAIKFDNSGNLIVADLFNNRIRKITPSGVVTTVAGSGTVGNLDGNATTAQFDRPMGVTIAKDGTIYVADAGNNRIRKISTNGVVSTIAGSTSGSANGNGTTAQFQFPTGIDIDSQENLYVTDFQNHRIRKITPNGDVTTFAGSSRGYRDATGTAAQFTSPRGILIDKKDNIFIAEAGNIFGVRIRKISLNRAVSSVAGSSSRGFSDGSSNSARFQSLADIDIDSKGDLYVADRDNHRIRKVTFTTKLTGTPTTSDIGTHNVVLEVNDGKGGVTQQSFTITVSDITAPTISNLSPTNNTIINTIDGDLEITFSEDIMADTGNISIYNQLNDTLVESISVTSSDVTISNNTVTVSTNNLAFDESYYVQIDATAFKDASNNYFLGIIDNTTWAFSIQRLTNTYTASRGQFSTTNSWSLGRVPIETDNVIVASGANGSVDINNLVVNNLTVLGNVTIRTTSSIIVNGNFSNTGQFVIVSDATDSGVLLVKGNTTGTINYARGGLLANKWSLVSPLAQNQLVIPFAKNASNNIRINTAANPDRYAIGYYESLNTPGNRWQYFNENTNSSIAFEVGTGYTVSRATDGAVIFTGNLQVDDVNKNVIGNQWNAIGNSFTAYYPLNKNSGSNFLTENASKLVIPAAYTWDNSQSKYVATTNLVTSTEKFLPPGQGFFVRPNANTTLLFDEQKRSTRPSSGSHIFAKSSATTPYIKLFVSGEKTTVNTDIIFSMTATKGFDKSEDIENFNGASFDINTHLVENSDGKNYTIQSLPFSIIESAIIPIHITAKKDKEITLSLSASDVPENIDIYLEDKITNTFKKLNSTKETSYTVILEENTNSTGRFYLHSLAKTLKNSSENSSSIQLIKKGNNRLSISGILNQKATVHIYNTLGKEIFKTSIVGRINNLISLPNVGSGVYTIKVITKRGSATKKIIIE